MLVRNTFSGPFWDVHKKTKFLFEVHTCEAKNDERGPKIERLGQRLACPNQSESNPQIL